MPSALRTGVSADRRKVTETTEIVEQGSFSICFNFVLQVEKSMTLLEFDPWNYLISFIETLRSDWLSTFDLPSP